MSSPAPKSPELSDKSKKYDRQIRLWGEHGQALLEAATICLVNVTAVGCETAKGLVLPGIGGFMVADGSTVTEMDLGNNFFLNASYIGKSKALACMQLLQELNPDVNGEYVDESIDYILANRPSFFESFDLVIASNLNEQTLLLLSNRLWVSNVPLVYCRSLGMLGTIRIQLKEHCIIEAHPDNRQFDLRLEQPFEALREHLESTEVTSKVPWLLVLYKYLKAWQSKNGGGCQAPSNYREKTELREVIRADMTADEENYEEAIKAVNTAFGAGLVPLSLKEIFDDDACEQLHKKSDAFWIMAKALKHFVVQENKGYLPVPGVLPDMTANTDSYIALQHIYRQQAAQDADHVYHKCQDYLKALALPMDSIDERIVRLLCREAAGLIVLRGTRISDEYEKSCRLQSLVEDNELQGSLTAYNFALRAYERFLTECGNIPGDCTVEQDIGRLKSIASKMLVDLGLHATISDDILHEICRFGGAELHAVSAFIGGCAAQEVIKILTKQYKPIDNTFIYNAISTESVTLRL
ncbi:nedd8-activating enzyme E1 regulatory subunit [Scaptodrosophila lebanonensis]|uniref:NEDD8-activating enzyme E1 regulatory subunit n=1 Tax=Drosophila lebanonensis TaxID=7225 RepID=A0A6J2UCU6_DROLE|nr:nedd8-activating enzyme E1 regulatory subunit [Scaptodrosophila lebanonensis]